jgi:hypothetical protein
MRRPLFIATTSLTRAGVEACADFLEAIAPVQRAEAPPKPALAIGTLVQEDGVICGTYPPNPIELAHDRWHQLPPERKSALAKWIVEYVSMVIESINLDKAYFKLVKRGWAHAYVNYIS